eukprot:PhF_6_TR12895/c0_g1_i1/m.20302
MNFGAWYRLHSKQPEPQDSDHSARVAGLEGETMVNQLITTLKSAYRTFRCRRVPTGKHTKREIDLICVGPVLLVVEIKNWSGILEVDEEGNFMQTRRNGDVIRHGRVGKDLDDSVTYLLKYLTPSVPREAVVSLIVMSNTNLKWSLETQKRCPALVRRELLSSRIPDPQGLLSWAWCSMLSTLGFSNSGQVYLSSGNAAMICTAVDSLPTWDVVQKENGTTLRGNIRSITISGIEGTGGDMVIPRKEMESVSLYWNSAGVWGFVKACVGGSLGSITVTFRGDSDHARKHKDNSPLHGIYAVDGAPERNFVSFIHPGSETTVENIPFNRIQEIVLSH